MSYLKLTGWQDLRRGNEIYKAVNGVQGEEGGMEALHGLLQGLAARSKISEDVSFANSTLM